MIKRLKPKSKFSRNVLTLMAGTTISQAIPIAITPILTRLYSPEDFGIYGFIMAMVLILSIFGTAKFEHVIFIVKRECVSDLVLKFTLLNAVFFSSILSLVITLLPEEVSRINSSIPLSAWSLIPLGVVTVSSYVVLRAWLNKQAKYSVIRSNLIKQSMTYSILQIVFAFIDGFRAFGLMLGDICGKGLTTVLILKRVKFKRTKLTKNKYFYFWKRYKLIPIYQLPASLVNVCAIYAPMLLLPLIFNASLSGAFFLVFKVVMAPISIIGNAFLDVFKKDAADAIAIKGHCTSEFVKTFKILLFFSIAIFFFFFFLSDVLFTSVFGKEWSNSGSIAASLASLAALRFLVSPLSYVIILKEKFSLNLLLQFFLCSGVLISLVLGWFYKDFDVFLSLFSYLSGLCYVVILGVSYRLARNV